MSPTVSNLVSQYLPVGLVEFRDCVDGSRSLCNERSFVQQWDDIVKLVLAGKILNIFQELLLGNADERALDSVGKPLEW